MAYVRSLEGYRPPKRFDDEPFTQARIEESVAKTGPWTELEAITLDPVDDDPSDPESRNFTVANATLLEGWYRIIWVDADSSEFVSGPTRFAPSAQLASLDDVARVLHIDDTSELSAADLERIEVALAVASSRARTFLKQPNLGSGEQYTQTFWDVSDGEFLPVSGTPVQVLASTNPEADPTDITAGNWTAEEDGVRLRGPVTGWGGWYGGWMHDPRYADRLNSSPRLRVDVVVNPDELDPIITEAVALAAAGLWRRSPRVAKGFRSETLGDYSYQLAGTSDTDPVFAEMRSMLSSLHAGSVRAVP